MPKTNVDIADQKVTKLLLFYELVRIYGDIIWTHASTNYNAAWIDKGHSL